MNPLFCSETILDSADQAFVSRELEFVRARTYDIKYPELKARKLVPVDREVNPGAETVKYDQYDMVGVAKIIANYADDLPRADVRKKEFRATVKGLGESYGYSLQEMRAASMAGVPLEQRKANSARRQIEVLLDTIAATGDSATGMLGLLNQTNAQSYTIPNGASGTATWASKTGLEILADMVNAVNKVVKTTNDLEHPDTMLLPTDQYGIIASTPLQSGSPVTILQHFLASNPYIRSVEGWYKLAGAGSGATDRMVCYVRDPDHLQLVIPQEFEQLPPQQRNMEWLINCHMRTAGVVAYYPLAIIYADGI